MVGVSRVEIRESSSTLRDMMLQQETVDRRERLQCLYWLKSNQVGTVKGVAELLGRNRVTVQDWLRIYQDDGLPGLLGDLRKVGTKASKVPPEVAARLKELLSERSGFSSYKAIHEWLLSEGVDITYAGAHHYVRHQLGASLKVPRPQSINQDPERVALFRKP